jgi:osmoprotectant transport system permease protein
VESAGSHPQGVASGSNGGGGMNLIIQGFAWIFAPIHWTTTALQTGIPDALSQHLILSGISLLIAAIIALPLGLYIGHSGTGRSVAVIASNIGRALPSLGLLSILLLVINDPSWLPSGYLANVIVFVLLGIPAILAGGYAGLEQVNRQTIDAARAVGMTEWQILVKVEIPLGAGLIVGGLRSGALQIIATVTISAVFGQVSLGTFIQGGNQSADYPQLIAGAILVAALALIVDGILALVQRFVVPRGLTRATTKTRNTTARGVVSALPIKEGN